MPSKGKLTIHEKLAAQYLALGMSLTEAATSSDLDLTLLRKALAHPLFEAEVERCKARAFPGLVERLGARLEQLQEPALNKMGSLLGAESEPVQFQAAKDLLNRGPLGSSSRGGVGVGPGGVQINLDQQALHAILAGALNMGQRGIVAAFAALGTAQEEDQSAIIDIEQPEGGSNHASDAGPDHHD